MDALIGDEDVVQLPDFEAAVEKTWLAWVPTDGDVPATSGRRRVATNVQRERRNFWWCSLASTCSACDESADRRRCSISGGGARSSRHSGAPAGLGDEEEVEQVQLYVVVPVVVLACSEMPPGQ
jgi:hypothetical protein